MKKKKKKSTPKTQSPTKLVFSSPPPTNLSVSLISNYQFIRIQENLKYGNPVSSISTREKHRRNVQIKRFERMPVIVYGNWILIQIN